MVITSVPGGVTDVTGRALAQELSKAWGQPVIVENKGGAAHIIGAQAVATAAPDGYTLHGRRIRHFHRQPDADAARQVAL